MTTLKQKTEAIYTHLYAAAEAGVKVQKDQDRLATKREGAYSHAIQAAIAAEGDHATFMAVTESFMNAVRSNADGVAKALKAPVAKPDKEGNPRWKVPGSISTAKSVLGTALEFGIALSEDGEPRSYGAIRKDADTKRAEAERENESDVDRMRREIRENCEQLSERAAKLDGDLLERVRDAIGALYASLNASKSAGEAMESAVAEATSAKPAPKPKAKAKAQPRRTRRVA